MITARVTSKGQVTIPKEIRERLGVHPGEDVGFEERDNLLVISKVVTKSPFDKCCLLYTSPSPRDRG